MLVLGTAPAKNLLWHKTWRALCWFGSLDWHSVGQGHSSEVKGKLWDVCWGQGQHQEAGHPSWQYINPYRVAYPVAAALQFQCEN